MLSGYFDEKVYGANLNLTRKELYAHYLSSHFPKVSCLGDIPGFSEKEYSQICNVPENTALAHYLASDRIFYSRSQIPDFSWEIYLLLNPDLNMIDEVSAWKHFLVYGKSEGRSYKLDVPDDFDYRFYIAVNEDLKYMSEVEAKIHYIKFGEKEGRLYTRVIPNDFDWKEYISLNIDLKIDNEEDAKSHFIYNRHLRFYKRSQVEEKWKEALRSV